MGYTFSTRGRRMATALAVTAALGVAACGSDDDAEEPSGPSADATPAAGASVPEPIEGGATPEDIKYCDNPTETVKIGSAFELSGPILSFGQPSSQGVQMAAKEISDKGGFEVDGKCYEIQLVERDVRSDASTTVATTRGLLRDEGVDVIFGPTAGSLSSQAGQISQSEDGPKPIHFGAGTGWELAGLMGQEDTRGLFRTSIPANLAAESFLAGVKQYAPDVKSIYFLYQDDDASKYNLDENVIPQAEKLGYEVAGNDRFPLDTTDFSSYLLRIKAANPDMASFGYLTPINTQLAKQASELDLSGPYHGWAASVSIPLKDATGSPLDVPYFASYQVPDLLYPQTPAMEDYLERFKAFTGEEPNASSYFSLWYYDPFYMLIKAMQDAGTTTDREKIREALSKVQWDGALGPECWDANNTAVYGTYIGYVENGETQWFSYPQRGDLCA